MDLTVANYAYAQPFFAMAPYLQSPLYYPDPVEYLNRYYKYYDGKGSSALLLFRFIARNYNSKKNFIFRQIFYRRSMQLTYVIY